MTSSPSWTAFHHRGEVLRAVTDDADLRRDGVLPMQLPGVTDTFRDELDLIGALQLRWHTRLTGQIERQLTEQPMDLGGAVRRAWAATAEELPGIRAIIDRYTESPTTPEMGRALTKAATRERVLLATMAGRAGLGAHSRAGGDDRRAETLGTETEPAARPPYQPSAPAPTAVPAGSATFVARIKAVLAA